MHNRYLSECSRVSEQSASKRFLRRIGLPAALAGTVLFGAESIEAATPIHADTGLVFPVEHTGNGVFARNSPHWNDTQRIAGDGAYDGDNVELLCGVTDGDPVGPYNNRTWHKVIDLNRSSEGQFWINDHLVKTPVNANQLVPGERDCEEQQANQGPRATSIFFSPISGMPNGLALPNIASINYALNDWSSGDCSDWKTHKLLENMPSTINTLAGWSRGRMGPAYFLETATEQRKEQIHTIILFDPGDTVDFTHGGCETNQEHRYDLNALYGDWVKSDLQNRLFVYTGIVSEEGPAKTANQQEPFDQQVGNGALDAKGFTGLWKYYFADIWNQSFANQVQVCDYSGMSHTNVLKNFYQSVKNMPSVCPDAPGGQRPVAWNP